MTRLHPTWLALASLGVAGCGARTALSPGEDGGPPGMDAGSLDAGPPCPGYVEASCAGPGTGPRPGQRPSDSQAACTWLPGTPPGLGGDLACCDLGRRIDLDVGDDDGGPVTVARTEDGVVVGWSFDDARRRRLGPDGTPLDDGPVVGPGTQARIAAGGCQLATAGSGRLRVQRDDGAPGFDEALGALDGFTQSGVGHHVAYAPLTDGFVTTTPGTLGGSVFLVEAFEPGGAVTRQDPFGTNTRRDAAIAAVGSRMAVTWVDAGGEVAFATAAPGERLGVAIQIPGMAPLTGLGGPAITSFRDEIVVATATGSDVRVAIADPFAGTVRISPRAVAETEVWGRVALAAADELAVIGVCFSTGPPPFDRPSGRDGVGFRLLSMDAVPLGPTLTIANGLRSVAPCGLAWSGEAFVVAWWDTGAGRVRVRTVTIRR